MTRDEFVTLLQARLGNRTDLADMIILEMQFAQSTILEGTGAFTPWFLATEMTNTNTVAGEERVELPTDFLAEIEEQSLWLYDVTSDSPYTELHKRGYDTSLLRYQTQAIPRQYSIEGNYLLLRPIPDVEYNIRWRYYAKEPVLSTNIENKWLIEASDLFLAEVGNIMAGVHLQNDKLAMAFQQAAGIARQRLYTFHEARKHVNRTYGMGED